MVCLQKQSLTALIVVALCLLAQPARAACDTVVSGRMDVPAVGVRDDLGALCMGVGSELWIGDAATGNAVYLSATGSQLTSGGYIYHWNAQHPGTQIDLYGTTTLTLPGATDIFTIGASPFDTSGMNVINHGTVLQTGAGMLNFSGTARLVNETGAVYNLSGGTGIRVSSSLQNKGTLNTWSGAISGAGVLDNASTGVFAGNLQPGAYGSLSVTNAGSFQIGAGNEAHIASFTNNAGTLVVNGTMENVGGVLSHLGGTLSGTGIINGDVFVGGGPGVAVFNPGSSPGTMTINGNFELKSGGVLNLEIAPDGSGGFLFDRLVVGGDVYLDGQVNFLLDPAITGGWGGSWGPLSGISFFDCPGDCNITYNDNFSWAIPGRPDSLISLNSDGLRIDYLAPVPEPSTYALLLAGLGLLGCTARRRQRG